MKCATVALIFLSGIALFQGCAAAQDAAPAVKPPRAVEPRQPDGPFDGLYSWSEHATAPLGIGRLHPDGSTQSPYWMSEVSLPLFDRPQGTQWGWINRGWLEQGDESQPFSLAGMVETEYEVLSFVVTREAPDGWLQVRFGAPTERDQGLAWLHRDHLAIGPLSLNYETWNERFMSDEISPLYLRGDGPRVLRSAPSQEAEAIDGITGTHSIEPLEFNGEWLRVRVSQPSGYCTDDTGVKVTEGWITWWAEGPGPLVWHWTRGC
ncbi:MAG: hypothetical protein WEF86_16545 [Gemmatimonadota bacterium]